MSKSILNRYVISSLAFLCSMPRGEGLEVVYESKDAIPAGYEDLYTEKDGKMVLTGIKGVKTQQDVDKLQQALVKERNDHKATKQTYAPLAALGSVDEIVANLDRIAELEASQGKGGTPADVEKLLQAKLAPLQRELETTKAGLAERDTLIASFKSKEQRQIIAEQVRKAAKVLKIRDTAVEDAVMYGQNLLTVDDTGNVVTKENAGVAAFVSAEELLRDLVSARPHWLEESVGGGSNGSRGSQGAGVNPYSHDHWNLGEQMRIYKENPEKAKQMAARFGVDPLNPSRPPKK